MKRLISKLLRDVLGITMCLNILLLSSSAVAQSQNSTEEIIEKEIRRLEAEQVEYLLNDKVPEMVKNWTTNFTVNNPFNVVQDARTGPIQSGTLTYSRFERNIEKILIHDSIVVVMGNEFIIPKTAPKGSSHDTDQPIIRRFTNVWISENGKWLMIARHANNVCSD
jgi:hypothetical protein